MKCSYKCETHLLHPFWKVLHKISRTISFEHNALRDPFVLATKLFISRKCFYLVHNLFRPLLPFFFRKIIHPYLGKNFVLLFVKVF